MRVKLYYEAKEDNFEGEVNTYLLRKEINYRDLIKHLNKMAEDSDGELSYHPLFIIGHKGLIMRRFD